MTSRGNRQEVHIDETAKTRRRILLAIKARGTVDNPKELVTEVGLGAGVHNIVHQLWRLQKAGLVSFRERSPRSIPTRIRLTPKGEKEVADWE